LSTEQLVRLFTPTTLDTTASDRLFLYENDVRLFVPLLEKLSSEQLTDVLAASPTRGRALFQYGTIDSNKRDTLAPLLSRLSPEQLFRVFQRPATGPTLSLPRGNFDFLVPFFQKLDIAQRLELMKQDLSLSVRYLSWLERSAADLPADDLWAWLKT